jgi:hypothetical protein
MPVNDEWKVRPVSGALPKESKALPSAIGRLRALAPAQPQPRALPQIVAPFGPSRAQSGFSVRELRAFMQQLTLDEFVAQLGPFALIQRPQDPAIAQRAREIGAASTGGRLSPTQSSQMFVAFMTELEHLRVASLPPLRRMDELTVGRLPDSDLMIDDPSVSKRHAILRWDGTAGRARVCDRGSRNGTSVNGLILRGKEAPLNDGDLLMFGDAGYLYMLSDSLHRKLVHQDEGLAVAAG